jgi:tetratricopeptide (TPR) repeat protein
MDGKLFNDQIRKYLSDRIWVEFYRVLIQQDQTYIGIAIVPPRGPMLERFQAKSPCLKPEFLKGYSALREKDSTRILNADEADAVSRNIAGPLTEQVFNVDEPNFRILRPEYDDFVLRDEPCREVESALQDQRSSVVAITGIGGTGKTALATWATLRAYEKKNFDFIVSITAKDRELSTTGIRALKPKLTTFESLLDTILDVLGFSDVLSRPVEEKENSVRSLLERSNGLIYVDNLETVDDARVIHFLDTLPVGVRAITTSRRTSVRTSIYPIALGSMTDGEASKFISKLASKAGLGYIQALKEPEKNRISRACDGLPLAIKWTLAKSRDAAEALAAADAITASQKKGEELLEFSFRRVFDSLTGVEKSALEVLSLFQRPLLTEAIVVGSNTSAQKVIDCLDDLLKDSMIQRTFDADQNDYCYSLLPITRAFVYTNLNRQPGSADNVRTRMADWFEAKDVADLSERLIVREIRQGKGGAESALLDLAAAAEKKSDTDAAQNLYEKALQRNQSSWKAARSFAEFYRHKKQDISQALRYYEQAAANAPNSGHDRALIFREWGMLLRDSGDPLGTDKAIDNFEIALKETPNDVICKHALAHMLKRKGAFNQVIEQLAPLAYHVSPATRHKTYPLLLEAYEQTGEQLKAAQIKAKMNEE